MKCPSSLPEISASQLRALIDEWILSERDRAILKRRLLDGICYDRLAEEFDMSPRHIKRICYIAIERLERHWPLRGSD